VSSQAVRIMLIVAAFAVVIVHLVSLLPYRRLNVADNKRMKIARIPLSVILAAIAVVYAVIELPAG